MKSGKLVFSAGVFVAGLLLFSNCKKSDPLSSAFDPTTELAKGGGGGHGGGGGGGGTTETAGNNLSFPVIWAENTTVTLRVEPPTGPQLTGDWWYVWGEDPIDPQGTIFSCNPDAGDPCYPEGTTGVMKAYLQKDANNIWQAYNAAPTEKVIVDNIDWGDNLESTTWGLTSKIRVEVGLYDNFLSPVKEYLMRHVSGWGTDEVHGLATDLAGTIQMGPGTQGTVYTPLARLTIQKLSGTNLTWNATSHMWTGDASTPIYNHAIAEGGTGPTYFGAEVNVKGKIIYGYAWDVKKLNTGAGTYRLTFSFDDKALNTPGNTIFQDGITTIIPPTEGVTAQLDAANNLTYIDISLTGKASGGGGGQGGGGGGGKPTR